jgi:hypothetical protein
MRTAATDLRRSANPAVPYVRQSTPERHPVVAQFAALVAPRPTLIVFQRLHDPLADTA